MLNISNQYFESLSQYFFRKGKKQIIRKLFTKLLIQRAKRKKESMHKWLNTCYYSARPYIKLKTRIKRRGKRVLHRLTFLEKTKSERLSYLYFVKQFKSKKKRFLIENLQTEIESLGTNKKHVLRVERNKIHKTGLKIYNKQVKKKYTRKNKKVFNLKIKKNL